MKIAEEDVSDLGIGTWHIGGGDANSTMAEMAALRYGLDHGLSVIDTAEMYGEGKAETLVGQAIKTYDRSQLYLISKFYPWHATPAAMRTALTASLQRLGTDYLDLYLLHWPGDTPASETLAGLQALKKEGLIRQFGVSNFDVAELRTWLNTPGGDGIVANEVLYNLKARGIDYDLLPFHRDKGIATIGYSPFNSGRGDSIRLPQPLQKLAASKSITPHQLLLAWTLRSNDVMPIPKAGSTAHMAANIAALQVHFSPDELALIDQAFPAPTHKVPLATI